MGMVLFPFASMGGITLTAACVAHVAVYLSTSKSWVKVKNLVFLFLVFIALASLLFMWLESWTWGQSMFFLYNVATTTGLSEEVPTTTAGRLCFCFIMMVVFSVFTTLVKLMVDHMRQGSDAECTDAEDMTRSQMKQMIRVLFDTEEEDFGEYV
jgi:TRAP-type C4-dicarboxylate transport system permease small subunit